MSVLPVILSFFFNDTATTEIYTLSLHDALPISGADWIGIMNNDVSPEPDWLAKLMSNVESSNAWFATGKLRSEEHTSELQSHLNLVCRLLLEKKKNTALFYQRYDLHTV